MSTRSLVENIRARFNRNHSAISGGLPTASLLLKKAGILRIVPRHIVSDAVAGSLSQILVM